jgi:hypothetical protein
MSRKAIARHLREEVLNFFMIWPNGNNNMPTEKMNTQGIRDLMNIQLVRIR